jgi:hypothetical protein
MSRFYDDPSCSVFLFFIRFSRKAVFGRTALGSPTAKNQPAAVLGVVS